MEYIIEYNIFNKIRNYFSSTKEICENYGITNYTINSDGYIDVQGTVFLSKNSLRKLPLKFNLVDESFSCRNNKLTTLEGSPKKLGDSFMCSYNRLENLIGAPETIVGYFFCDSNRLTSFEGAPKTVGGDFDCGYNKIRDLYDIPKVQGDIYLVGNPVLTIVQYFLYARGDKQEWIDLFNELDIIQDRYNVILDRIKYFYEGTILNMDVSEWMLSEIRKEGYNII